MGLESVVLALVKTAAGHSGHSVLIVVATLFLLYICNYIIFTNYGTLRYNLHCILLHLYLLYGCRPDDPKFESRQKDILSSPGKSRQVTGTAVSYSVGVVSFSSGV